MMYLPVDSMSRRSIFFSIFVVFLMPFRSIDVIPVESINFGCFLEGLLCLVVYSLNTNHLVVVIEKTCQIYLKIKINSSFFCSLVLNFGKFLSIQHIACTIKWNCSLSVWRKCHHSLYVVFNFRLRPWHLDSLCHIVNCLLAYCIATGPAAKAFSSRHEF